MADRILNIIGSVSGSTPANLQLGRYTPKWDYFRVRRNSGAIHLLIG
jgi:hypothetical protein